MSKEYTYDIDKYTIGVDENGEDGIGMTVAKIENGEINFLGNCYGENARCLDLLIKENKQLKDDWNKLKEYIRKTKLKEFEKSYGRRYGKTFTQAEVILCNMITNYMQELEKENDSNE